MKRSTIGLLMAGGAGSRMAKTHSTTPKPLVEIAGVPLIVLSIRRLLAAGVEDIRVALHYRSQEIIHALRQRSELPQSRLQFIVEEDPLGTIGALAELRGHGQDVLVQNSDLLSGIDLRGLLRHHETEQAQLTIATHMEFHRLKLGEVITDERGRVSAYHEKPLKQYRISSGTNVVGPECLELCVPCEFTPFPDLVNLAVSRGMGVADFHHDTPWIDVNDAADVRAAERMFEQDPVAFGLFEIDQEEETS